MKEKVNKILIVDDEEDITIAISDFLKRHSPTINPIVCNDPRLVFPILSENPDIRLILSDFRMPAINGLDLLLRVKAQYPRILFIIMTGYGTPELEKEGLRRGAIRYVEKPFDISELVEIIQESLRGTSAGFGGVIEEVQLPDIIQLIGMSGRTVALSIVADQGRGTVFFQDGEVVHAVCGSLTGEEAFYQIFDWSGGQFALAARSPGEERTIFGTWQGLLLEAARRQDESKAGEAVIEEAEEPLDQQEDLMDLEDVSFGEQPPDDSKLASEIIEESTAAEPELLDPESAAELYVPDSEISELSSIEEIEEKEETEEIEDIGIFEKEDVEDKQSPEREAKAETGEILTTKLIGDCLPGAVDKYFKEWPGKSKKLYYKDLPVSILSKNLQMHLSYQFQLLVNRMVRLEDTPFDLKIDPVNEALENLLHEIRSNWEIKKDQYRGMLHSAIRFELARTLDPARAITQFLQEHSDGIVSRIKKVLKGLIDHELIFTDFKQLVEELDRHGDPRLHPKKVENFLRTILDRRNAEKGFELMMAEIYRLLEVANYGLNTEFSHIQFGVVIHMLESRGLQQIADFVKVEKRVGKKAISVKDLEAVMERYRIYKENQSG